VELAISRIVNCHPDNYRESVIDGHQSGVPLTTNNSPLTIWGISATIGNLSEAKEVLMSPLNKKGVIVRATMDKKIEGESIYPDEIEKYPLAGHLGIKLAQKIVPNNQPSKATPIFDNTRGLN